MKIIKVLTIIVIIFAPVVAKADFVCETMNNEFKRCENDEVICYVYDSGWAGIMKSGRGAGISCKFKEEK